MQKRVLIFTSVEASNPSVNFTKILQSEHLESRASKISGPFGMHSSLFHLNHLTFQCSNSSSQVHTCCLHHWQHCSSEQGHSCAHKDFISFSKKQGYQWCRRLLCSGYPAGRSQEVVEGFHRNIPNWNSWRSATSHQRWHPCCWLAVLISPAHQAPNKRNHKENHTQERDMQQPNSHPPPFPFLCYPEQVAGIRGI